MRKTALLIACTLGWIAGGAEPVLSTAPATALREFNTDRPDKTESPFTVDQGHFQLETDIVNFTQDRADGVLSRTWNFGQMNLKYGLSPSADFQIIAPLFNVSQTEGEDTRSGFGDVVLRVKWNFFGNDDGPLAVGLIPFVKLPTAAEGLGNGRVEGGLILPVALTLPGGWSLGTMLEVDTNQNDGGDGYHAELISSLTLGHDLFGGLGFYTEFYSQSSAQDGASWVATFDTGLGYTINSRLKIDSGINLGLTAAADDWNPFVGVSLRF